MEPVIVGNFKYIICLIALLSLLILPISKAYCFSGDRGGGGLPPPGNSGNLLMSNGLTWLSIIPGGDLVTSGTTPTDSFTLTGQEGIPYTGTALSGSIPGQFRSTDGAGHMIVGTVTYAVIGSIPGAPVSTQAYPLQVPYPLNFNANFAASTGIAAASNSCGASPSGTETWTVKCIKSGSLTTIGTIAVSTSCNTAGDASVTFSTTGGTAQACAAGRFEFDAPAGPTSTSPVFVLVGHN